MFIADIRTNVSAPAERYVVLPYIAPSSASNLVGWVERTQKGNDDNRKISQRYTPLYTIKNVAKPNFIKS